MAKRDPDRGAIARPPDYHRQIDRVFDQLMRQFEQNPFRALAQLPARLGDLAEWPPIDIAEDDRGLTIRVDVPGLSLDDLSVGVSGNVLTIRGEREDEWTDNKRGVIRRERVSGTFARAIQLPSYVDPSSIQATYDQGTLTISVPKIEGQGPRHVQVTTGGQTAGQTAGGGQSSAGGQSPPQSAAAAQSTRGQTSAGPSGAAAQQPGPT
jgi:HSP20 family protein